MVNIIIGVSHQKNRCRFPKKGELSFGTTNKHHRLSNLRIISRGFKPKISDWKRLGNTKLSDLLPLFHWIHKQIQIITSSSSSPPPPSSSSSSSSSPSSSSSSSSSYSNYILAISHYTTIFVGKITLLMVNIPYIPNTSMKQELNKSHSTFHEILINKKLIIPLDLLMIPSS